ncbi:MAG TPA: DUF1697 domain-containing protein [Pyrinomonadaceae bacterium]|jgi:uncharacterized protein (DUF1697 family)|nr:DUF1697 domain-containing protein [Pyrinomonadaceae bacterium]
MPLFFAFLRAINVGGRRVAMDDLRRVFESLGYSSVETFIASGNVIFEAEGRGAAALEDEIEDALRAALGYEVTTFVRTGAELAAVASREPFGREEDGAALNVAFLKETPGRDASRKLSALRTEADDFRLVGREVYWLCRTRQSESAFSNAVLEKTLGLRSTLRTASTVRKMAAKYNTPAR